MLDGVRHGLANRQIAVRRGVSIDAVKYHVANALAKLGFQSRAELRRWSGAPKESNMQSRRSAKASTDISAIGQISRNVRDIAAARKWYQGVLGLRHLYSFGDLAFFDCGGVRLFLSQREGEAAAESIVYFAVEDINAACAALESRGGRVTNAPHMVHKHDDGVEEWMAFFEDNEGRPLAFMAQLSNAI